MDLNEVDPESAGMAPAAKEADAPRPGLLRSSWKGAKTGFRWVSYVAGPVAVVLLILGLILSAFGFGIERGWRRLTIVPQTFGFYFVFAVWGGILGAVVGLIGGLIRRAFPGIRAILVGRAESADPHPREGSKRDYACRRGPIGVPGKILALAGLCADSPAAGGRVRDRRLPLEDGRSPARRCHRRGRPR